MRVNPTRLLAENLAHCDMVCSGSLNKVRKPDKCRTKEEVAGPKKNNYAVDEKYLKSGP